MNYRIGFLLLLFACTCSSAEKKVERSPSTPLHSPKVATLDEVAHVSFDAAPTMQILLSDGNPQAQHPEATARPSTKPLSKAQIGRVLSRLDPLPQEPGDKAAFHKREKSLPPPKTGNVVRTQFPSQKMLAPPEAQVANEGPLRLLRHQPEGDVSIVPHVSVTFNQPMVVITSQRDTLATVPSVRISPRPPGAWRWVGSKTLLFEPTSGRFPMATKYTVTVPGSIRSKSGKRLGKTKHWTFQTPTLRVETSYPNYGTFGLDQAMFLQFNQRVEPSQIVKHIRILARGAKNLGVQALDPESVEDLSIQRYVANAKKGQFIVFRAAERLPYDATIQVTVKKGAVSAEGPIPTKSGHTYSFRTYGPLKVIRNRCGYKRCRPYDSFSFQLSNNLHPSKFDEAWLQVEPSFPSMTVSQHGQWVYINGNKPGRRTYTVTFSPQTTDAFDQQIRGKRTFSFKVGPAEPSLSSTAGQMTVIDPFSNPGITIYTTNYLQVAMEVYRVSPKHWGRYIQYKRDWDYYGKKKIRPPGKRIAQRKISLDAAPGDFVETLVSLQQELGKKKVGHLVVHLYPTKATKGSKLPKYRPSIRTWVQATQIGLDAMVDQTDLSAWATNLQTGGPIPGVQFQLAASGRTGVSNKDGLALLSLPKWKKAWDKRAEYLSARKGEDIAFLPPGMWGGAGWRRSISSDTLGWYVLDDRKMYKPGETIRVKGWMRVLEPRKGGMVRLDAGIRRVRWTAFGPMGNQIGKGEAKVRGFSGFDFSMKLPKTPNLGQGSIRIEAVGTQATNRGYVHSFQIQEFRTPEFKVSVDVREGPYFADQHTMATVSASYYAGGPLTNAKVSWNVQAREAAFRPPNLDKYSFGAWTPWWISHYGKTNRANRITEQWQGKTDAAGTHDLRIALSKIVPPKPMTVQITGTVRDVTRQAWTGSKTLLVHPSRYYVGLKTDTYFVKQGEPLVVDVIAADVEGNIVLGRPVKLKATRVAHKWQRGKYIEDEKDPQTCDIMSGKRPAQCTFRTQVGGTYKIAASTLDDQGRPGYSQITRWVSGGDQPKSRRVEMERVTIVPDKDEYRPGEIAELMIQSPIVPAHGLVTLRRNGLVQERRIEMKESTMVIRVPVKESYLPNFHVQVNLVGNQPRLDKQGQPDQTVPPRPAMAQGRIQLKVPATERILDVQVRPLKKGIEPGAKTGAIVVVKDTKGKPVAGAEVALIVVDEAVLSLSNYALADPMKLFYATRPQGVRDYHSRTMIQLADASALQSQSGAVPAPVASPMTMSLESRGVSKAKERKRSRSLRPASAPKRSLAKEMSFAADSLEGSLAAPSGLGLQVAAQQKIAVRSNFDPLAVFAPSAQTNRKGIVRVSYKMPDNLTRYRIMAVAVKNATHYGSGEAHVTVRLPLMVRPSAPRFLNFGDTFALPIVVQNQTNKAMTVQVATRATNLRYIGAKGVAVKVPANDRVEVRFPAKTESVGTARFQVGVVSAGWGDAAQVQLPVYTPATSEAFAVYGVVDKGAIAQPVKRPTEVWPQFGGLEVSTSSTALQALTDAFLYLYTYTYQCAEQISSRMVSVAALRDVLSAFRAKGMPDKKAIARSMRRDIEELLSRQNHDGGFGLWRKGQRSWPYVSIHATHALVRANQKGYDVSPAKLNLALRHLKQIESYIPGWYTEWARRHIVAYSLYVRQIAGKKDAAHGRRLYRRAGGPKGLSFAAVGWLLGVLSQDADSRKQVAEIRRYLNNRVTETAGSAHYAVRSTDGDYVVMHSDRVADGVILESLIDDQPKSDLIPKIVRGLMAHRKRGRWGNTQENAFVLLALDKYFHRYEKRTPNFVARVWLGNQYAGEHRFRGRTTETHQIDIPLSALPPSPSQIDKLFLQKDGRGRLYYRIGMNYAPKSLVLEPAAHGFTVERVYQGADNPQDVKRRPDGTWMIKAGARVKISITLVAPTRTLSRGSGGSSTRRVGDFEPCIGGSGRYPRRCATVLPAVRPIVLVVVVSTLV